MTSKRSNSPHPPQGAVLVTLALCLLNNNTATRVHRHVQKLLDAFAGSSRGCDAPLRRGSNVAVLLYGQARTLNVTHCSIARNVLAPLLAEKHKVRIFVQGEADEDSWWGLPHTDTTGAVPFCPVPRVLCPVPCVLCPVPCALCPVHFALCPVPCDICPVPQCPLPNAQCHMSITMCPVPCVLYPR